MSNFLIEKNKTKIVRIIDKVITEYYCTLQKLILNKIIHY